MKHVDIRPTTIVIAAPSVVITSLLLRGIAVASRELPYVAIDLEDSAHLNGNRSADLKLSLGTPDRGDITARHCGSMTFGPYIPRQQKHQTGWIADTEPKYVSSANRLGYQLFRSAPRLRMNSVPEKIAAMKSLGLASILPDAVGRLDSSLRRVGVPDARAEDTIWLSVRRNLELRKEIDCLADWVEALISEAHWLNQPKTPGLTLVH